MRCSSGLCAILQSATRGFKFIIRFHLPFLEVGYHELPLLLISQHRLNFICDSSSISSPLLSYSLTASFSFRLSFQGGFLSWVVSSDISVLCDSSFLYLSASEELFSIRWTMSLPFRSSASFLVTTDCLLSWVVVDMGSVSLVLLHYPPFEFLLLRLSSFELLSWSSWHSFSARLPHFSLHNCN